MAGQEITLMELHNDLKDVAAKWESIGIQLRFGAGELSKIKADVCGHDGIVEYCFNHVVSTWLEGEPAKVTIDVLAEAVKVIGYGVLAREIRREADLKLDLKTLTKKLSQCKAKYFTLGIHLGVSNSRIKGFEKFAGDCSRCLLEMLENYMREKSPRVEEICDALDFVGRKDMSMNLSQKYRGRQFKSL